MKSTLICGMTALALLTAMPAWAENKRRAASGRAWLGIGTGAVIGDVEIPCAGSSGSDDCGEGGLFQSYTANLTASGAGGGTVRFRAVRAEEDNSAHHPYEIAALVGSRFGRSNWYGLLGAGSVRHVDDDFRGNASGLAWEIVFAPASEGGAGFELSFQGHAGNHVDYFGVSVGMRLGDLR